ncbi:MAG TPA: DUF2508 family protein [Clostridium sp.]|nr:DUF2508 family protein [Clostridium sp.]
MGLNTENNQNIKVEKYSPITKIFSKLLPKAESDIACDNDVLDKKELIECINRARNDWINANREFEYAQNDEIIDYYTYKIKACQVRYEYFLKLAKRKGITYK